MRVLAGTTELHSKRREKEEEDDEGQLATKDQEDRGGHTQLLYGGMICDCVCEVVVSQ